MLTSSERLDNRFFEMADKMPGNCDSAGNEETMIEYYECVFRHSTMVLYSRRTGAPIAALTLGTSADSNCQTIITRRPSPPNASEAYFQGMINKENAYFEFTISNLTPKGSINFNILHTPCRKSATNQGPAFGINEVNELSPNQSYTVKANQQNNRRMCLRGKTKRIQGQDSPLFHSVSVTEAESGTSLQGLYFCLSVVPEASCKPLVNLFAQGTVWKVVDGFAREVPVPPKKMYGSSLPQVQLSPSYGSSTDSSPLRLQRKTSDLSTFSISSRQRRTKCPIGRAAMKSIEIDSIMVPTPRGPKSMTDYDGDNLYDNPSRSISFNRASTTSIDIGDAFGHPPTQPRMRKQNTTMQLPIDFGLTQAAELHYGEEVQVNSESSNRVFDFDKASVPTVLCMSIWKEMNLSLLDGNSHGSPPSRVNDLSVEQEEIELQPKTCLVDFTSPVDTIIVPCGHQCFNSANIDRNITHCPLCRSTISTILPLSTMVEFS